VNRAQKEAAIVVSAISEYYQRKTYISPLLGIPTLASHPSSRQLEYLRHFAKQGVKVRLK
jgi:hypothetical protein